MSQLKPQLKYYFTSEKKKKLTAQHSKYAVAQGASTKSLEEMKTYKVFWFLEIQTL